MKKRTAGGPGQPVRRGQAALTTQPPSRRDTSGNYVFVMDFDGDKIAHVNKVWNDVHSLRQPGWIEWICRISAIPHPFLMAFTAGGGRVAPSILQQGNIQ